MQIEPNGLLAGNPLTPLESGHPFFRGNVMQGNGIDGLAVVTDRVLPRHRDHRTANYIGPIESRPASSPATTSIRRSTRSGTRPT